MNERKLNFAEKPVQVLTLDELEKSYHENLPTGDPVGGTSLPPIATRSARVSPFCRSWKRSLAKRPSKPICCAVCMRTSKSDVTRRMML